MSCLYMLVFFCRAQQLGCPLPPEKQGGGRPSNLPCKFGDQCTRPDCKFQHSGRPNGAAAAGNFGGKCVPWFALVFLFCLLSCFFSFNKAINHPHLTLAQEQTHSDHAVLGALFILGFLLLSVLCVCQCMSVCICVPSDD